MRSSRSCLVGVFAAAILIFAADAGRASTITVTSTADTTADDGACTLREAIVAANTNMPSGVTAGECAAGEALPTVDTVAFDIPSSDPNCDPTTHVCTITLTDCLSRSGGFCFGINEAAIIDGYTQPGASPNTLAVGDDAHILIKITAPPTGDAPILLCSPTGCGLPGPGSDGSTIKGLCIVSNNHAPLVRVASNNDLIEGNFLGVDTDGETLPGVQGNAVQVISGMDGTTIGGSAPAARNVMACAGTDLILADGNATTIEGNYLGINGAGTAALGSAARAINVELGTGVTIGGTDAGAGNVIGTWVQQAIVLGAACACTTADVVIQGNLIGTDATGTTGISQGSTEAINVQRVGNLTVGGSATGAGNVIANPGGNGIVILGDSGGVSGVTIQGNKIGTDITGTSPIPNGACGITVTGSNGPAIGSIGGTGPGEGNVIAFNGTHGISISGGVTGWVIEGNSIFGNANLGITLGGDCGSASVSPTMNTAGSPHTGANDLQSFPVLDTPNFPGGASVSGTLNSTPSHPFRIEVFANDSCDPSGFGQGKTFVGRVDKGPSDMNGDIAFTVNFVQTIVATALTATATDLDTGDTSEFSACSAPATTTTTTSTSTTASTTTTTAPTTSTTSTTAGATTTTTTSSTAPGSTTTTTTQAAGGCANEPIGPTFASLNCRLTALIAEVGTDTDLGTLQAKLVDDLQKAKMHKEQAEMLCRQASKRRTKNALRPAINRVSQFLATLGSRKARTIPAAISDRLRTLAGAIRTDMHTLQRAVACPQDAP